jgi:hypothetical protein
MARPGASSSSSTADASQRAADRWAGVEPFARLVSATILIGAATGAVIGGIGGRIAMRILFLTSDDAVAGVTSDDGFEIGRFDLADTLQLVIVTTFLGVVAALFFLVAHPFVRPLGRWAVPAAAVFYGAVGGALLVHTDGVDFTLLEPAWLAIGLFVSLAAGFGAVVALFVARAAEPDAWPSRARWWLIWPPLLFLLILPFMLVAAVGLFVNWLAASSGQRALLWSVVRAAAIVGMVAVLVLGVVDLARDAAALV